MPQSGLGAGSAVLHQGRGMERSAQRQCRKGIRADHPGDVVQGIYRRLASEIGCTTSRERNGKRTLYGHRTGKSRRFPTGCSTGDVPQSGLGVESAVLHLRRETGKSASEHGRLGDGGRTLQDVVQVASEQDRLYYISGGKRGKAPRNTADWGTAAGLYGM